ncbi:MAG: hypothetical protein WAK43_06915, partial [Dehalococcoidales bacterium]
PHSPHPASSHLSPSRNQILFALLQLYSKLIYNRRNGLLKKSPQFQQKLEDSLIFSPGKPV